MQDITIYSTGTCPSCVQAKQLFKLKGWAFTEIRVDLHPDKLEEMLTKSGGARTVPQIFIGSHHVGGYDKLRELNSAGKLEDLLA